jgi:lipoyl(octanoyl) transferase
MSMFDTANVCNDAVPHSAAMNMSIDEALLESASIPIIRFYRWRSPALSFGYFGKFSDVAIYAAKRDSVRRWTGGGIVFHGDDLTYAIVIPPSNPVFEESSMAIYEKIHRALCRALAGQDQGAELITLPNHLRAEDRGARDNNCFANPVRADIMMNGRKIAGAAQRRTRRGLLQQGSIQGITMKADLAQKFAQALSPNCRDFVINEQILQCAQELAQQKYGTDSWLRKG